MLSKVYLFFTVLIVISSVCGPAYGLGKTRFDYRELDSYHGKVEVADIDNDGRNDVIRRGSGDESLVWYKYSKDGTFIKHVVIRDTLFDGDRIVLADIDRDGDIDLITGEHKGPDKKIQIWENDGKGNFTAHLVDKGKESHLGTRLTDLDGDGDLDVVSIAWDESQNVHVWRNDAIQAKMP